MRKLLLTTALIFVLGASPAPALVLWGLDNSANQSDPGTGAPWNAVAKVTNSDGSLLMGSAVYLGDGFLLTANHVIMDLTYSFITFDEVEFFSIDPSFNDGVRTYGKQVAPNVDMAVFKLTSIPVSATAVNLLAAPDELIAPATLIGWGIGRSDASPLESTNVAWGIDATSAKRWGLNEPKALANINYQAGSYEAIVTILGAAGPEFSPDGLGNAEAGATLYDSGSGLFQQIAGEWYLIGLTTAVEGPGSSVYGDDATSGAGRGDANFFARISTYEQDITALVPEPGTISLLALATAAMLAVAACRRRRG